MSAIVLLMAKTRPTSRSCRHTCDRISACEHTVADGVLNFSKDCFLASLDKPARALFGDEFEIKAIQLLVEDGIDAERKIVKFTNRVFRDDVSENHATLYSVTK
ncbi:hypothetical protein B0T25DRAFT_521684 [Lasiosphaeria hispida]|uniref:Uncharacterized protein n=1 Tax=Lasiosphaeria hispida TaxID=260671 RepID=A0AAJ0H839_9PEZI|nr:hypothetical protein B0T25DRAFT_521684 [Lasiosphaeria hispida]